MPLGSGRDLPMAALRAALTRLDSMPATVSARTARFRSGPVWRARHTVVAAHIRPWSPSPVTTLAALSSAGFPRNGSNHPSTS